MENNSTNKQVNDSSFLNTLQSNKLYLHKRKITRADTARVL